MAMTTLQWPDYLILAAFLVISLGIGVYHSLTGGRQRTTQEFIMANRHLSILPTTISLFVSFQSAIMVLGSTAEMYLYGIQVLIWNPIAFTIALVISERVVVPWMYRLKLMSVNDYFERRFQSKAVRILGSATSISCGIMYMGVAMYAPSAALELATGLPIEVSVPLMAVISVAYTALGGMRAVIWTDVFQCGAMLGGMLAIMIKGMIVIGGFQKVIDISAREGRMVFAIWDPDPTVRHSVWGFLFGMTTSWISIYGLSQASVQRYSATASLAKARMTILLNIPALWLITFIACSTGLTVFAYYAQIRCDPIANKDVANANQLLSLFVTTIFSNSRGFAGLFLATLYGGSLSSVSSSLSGAAANCWDDILRLFLSNLPESKKAFINRALVVVFGAIATGVAFLAATVPGPITQVIGTFASISMGPTFGLFVMGGISRHTNWKGALAGGLTALCINTWLNVGAFRQQLKYPTLPLGSVDGCSSSSTSLFNSSSSFTATPGSESWTTLADSFVYSNSTSSAGDLAASWSDMRPTGINAFYSLSYIWFTLFGTLTSVVIGIVTSLTIFRDREAEAAVDERLLLRFSRFFSCKEDDVDDEKPTENGKCVDVAVVYNNVIRPELTKPASEASNNGSNGHINNGLQLKHDSDLIIEVEWNPDNSSSQIKTVA